jgi:hypothetical protein
MGEALAVLALSVNGAFFVSDVTPECDLDTVTLQNNTVPHIKTQCRIIYQPNVNSFGQYLSIQFQILLM